MRFIIVTLLLVACATAHASNTRTIDADALRSSDRSRTITLPTTSGSNGQALTTNGSGTTSWSTVSGGGTWTQEVPSGTVNGSNQSFTLAYTPTANAAVSLYLDGLILVQGTDYTITGTSITVTAAPASGQSLYAVYTR